VELHLVSPELQIQDLVEAVAVALHHLQLQVGVDRE
jgi:hypothetical protein